MKSNTSIRKIKSEFTLQNVTSVGGIKVFLEYLERIKLSKALQRLSCTKAHNSLFPVYRILLYLIIGWILGCERLFHFRRLQYDPLIKRFLGGRCPHHSLLYKELVRLRKTCPNLRLDLRKLNHEVIQPCLPSDLILDLDSTVETVYGNQTDAAKGTSPHKPGRKSYHPLLAFEGQSRLECRSPGGQHAFLHRCCSIPERNLRTHRQASREVCSVRAEIEEIYLRMKEHGVEIATDGIKDRGGCGKEIVFYDSDGRKIELNTYGT